MSLIGSLLYTRLCTGLIALVRAIKACGTSPCPTSPAVMILRELSERERSPRFLIAARGGSKKVKGN